MIWLWRLRRWTGLAAITYGMICGILAWNQRMFLYQPLVGSPAVRTTELLLPVEGARIRVATRHIPDSPAIVYFGGNAEDVSGTFAVLSACFPDSSLYLMNYRGYHGSTGTPTEMALHADAHTLLSHVVHEHAAVTVIGRSLGSGVAVRLVAEYKGPEVVRLVLLTPFDSITHVAQHRFPWLPVNWLLIDRFESDRVAGEIQVPTLILVSETDDVVPRELSDALVRCFQPGIVRLVEIPGTDHNTISDSGLCWENLVQFVR